MHIDLTPAELKLLIVLLDRAGDEFGNHGCNDFSLLRDGELTPGEAEEMKSRLQAGLCTEEAQVFDNDVQYDWALLRYFQGVFERALEQERPVDAVAGRH